MHHIWTCGLGCVRRLVDLVWVVGANLGSWGCGGGWWCAQTMERDCVVGGICVEFGSLRRLMVLVWAECGFGSTEVVVVSCGARWCLFGLCGGWRCRGCGMMLAMSWVAVLVMVVGGFLG